jgi:hypothetical protein
MGYDYEKSKMVIKSILNSKNWNDHPLDRQSLDIRQGISDLDFDF